MTWLRWAPATLFGIGALVTVGVDTQRTMALRAPLHANVPVELHGFRGAEVTLSDEERRVAGVSSYLARDYSAWTDLGFSVYIGYYERQTHPQTIHSPKNCLPGAGWEALASQTARLATVDGEVTVNRYLIRKGEQRALVLYWYQGRGRVEANEYRVKWNLLQDAALRRRTEEALVRIVVPVKDTEANAFAVGGRVAESLLPAVSRSLPN